MNKRYSKKVISLAVTAGLSAIITSNAALASDIDIYLENPPESPGPNIMFVLDESGSMGWGASGSPTLADTNTGQRMYQLKQALRTLINDSSMDDVDVGIMGYRGDSIILTKHSDFVTVGDGTNRANLLNNVIGDAHLGGTYPGSLVHNGYTPSSPALQRAMNWYRGTAPSGWNTPVDTDVWCKPNHIVFMTDGDPNTNGMSTYGGVNCHTNERISNTWTNFQNTVSDNSGGRCSHTIAEWGYNHQPIGGTAWLDSKDNTTDKQPKNVITHTIGMFVTPLSDRENYLLDISERSPDEGHPIGTYPNADYAGGYDTGDAEDPFTGGRYYPANNAAQMLNAFRAIVESASSDYDLVYTSPSIPFDADSVAVSGSEIYVPMFKPEAEKFWKGNIKKYDINFNYSTMKLEVKDKNDADVVDSDMKFLSVVDFWNDGAADGGATLVGGAASKMTGSRNLYTYLGTESDLTHADNELAQSNTAITTADLGVVDAVERDSLLYWANWLEPDGTTARTGSMGAVLHSKPVVVRYGAAVNDLVLVTTTEGILHAFDSESGQELWSFMPDELLSTIKAAAANGTATEPMYGIDGPMTYYEIGANKYIVFGMRRGGRNYYALNISDRTAPTFAWEIIGGTGSFTSLGQTWSKPIYTQMQIENSTVRNVLVFGGGYDDDQDDATSRADDDLGNAIYIVNATTGALIKKIDSSDMVHGSMGNAVASDVLPIDINANGYTDRLYAADVGGRLIRVDIPDEALSNLTGTQDVSGTIIADIGGGVDAAEFQRFFNTPEVAYYKKGGYTYLALMIASGHRPKPLDDTVDDRFYAVRDFAVWRAPADDDNDTHPDYANVVDEDDLVDATTLPGGAATGPGWYIDLVSTSGAKQKGLSNAKVYDYVVLFTTYSGSSTSADACAPSASSGVSHLYAINMIDGSAILQVDGSDFKAPTGALNNENRQVELKISGLPPSPQLLFPSDSDDDAKLGGMVVATVGLTSPAHWTDRFHPMSWESVIDE